MASISGSREPQARSSARLNFRLPRELKELIENAAAYSGQSLSDFAVSTLAKSARDIVEQERITRLSLRDAKRFMEIMDRSNAMPNRTLRAAAKSYAKRVREQ
jgi:uncharacterized protein (DUF1778 family)